MARTKGSHNGIVYCTHCKKEVIRGVDSRIHKNGKLLSSHNSCNKEMNLLNIQYAHLLLGNKCQCCGSTKNIDAGHINFPKDKISKNKHTKSGFSVRTGDYAQSPYFLKLVETHAVIPVCRSCNVSMGNGSTCRQHNKYLGVWNHLPKLDDLEQLPCFGGEHQ